MTIHLILVGLLFFCSRFSCQDCNQLLEEDVDFSGTNIEQVYSPDVEHCQLMCTQHPSCLFFTFIRSDWTTDNRFFYCYLKSSSSGTPTSENPLVGVTSGYSLNSFTLREEPCLSKVYEDVDFSGADYKSFFTADYEECQRACTHDPGCQFFTFIKEAFRTARIRNKCFLKFSWSVPMTPLVQELADFVSGFSHNSFRTECVDPDCRSKLFQSTDIPGSDFLQVTASSPEHCRALCSAHPSCTYFTYVSETFQCYLKRRTGRLISVEKDGHVSGLPTRYCQPDNSWVEVPLEGINLGDFDIRNEVVDDLDACQTTCTDDPGCQFYAYSQGSCYLKRNIVMPAPPRVRKLTDVVSGFSLKNCWV